MSISSEITRLSGNVSAALSAISAKGVTVPAGSNSDDLATLIGQIQTGPGAVVVTEEPDTGGGTAVNITAVDISNDTVDAAHLLSGYTAHDRYGNSITGSASSGASNFVTGTFKGTTTGSILEIDIPYTGSGYPIAIMVYPSEGLPLTGSGGTFNEAIGRYPTAFYSAVKQYLHDAPEYSGASIGDLFLVAGVYKSSTTSAKSIASSYSKDVGICASTTPGGGSLAGAVRLSSSKKMSVYIRGSNYGFLANVEYTYRIIYSS